MGNATDPNRNRGFLVEGSSWPLVAIGAAFLTVVLGYSATTGEWDLSTFFAGSSACALIAAGFLGSKPAGAERVRRLYLGYILLNGIVFAVGALVLAAGVLADGGSAAKTVELIATGLMALMLLSIAFFVSRHSSASQRATDRK